jgi:hypothetical protein
MSKKNLQAKAEKPTTTHDYVPAKDPQAAEKAGIKAIGFGDNACCLVSRMDQPMLISYNGEGMLVPPRAGAKHPFVIEDSRLLGALPKGLTKIPLPSHLQLKK